MKITNRISLLCFLGFLWSGSVWAQQETVGQWHFNEGTGTIAYDASGNNNNGTLEHNAAWTTGYLGGAINFDGTDDDVEIANSNSLCPAEQMTMEGYFYMTGSTGEEQTILNKVHNSALASYQLRVRSDKIEMFLWDGANLTHFYKLTPIQNNRWYHVAGTFNGQLMKLWLADLTISDNLVCLDSSDAFAGHTIQYDNGPLYIGKGVNFGDQQEFMGTLDEIRISGRGEDFTGIKEHTLTQSAPHQYLLYDAYPNPFNPLTVIKYDISKPCQVTLTIFDIQGRNVATLVDERKMSGSYAVNWNVESLASGVYFYILKASDYNQMKKLVLLK